MAFFRHLTKKQKQFFSTTILVGVFWGAFFFYSQLFDSYGLRAPYPLEDSASYLHAQMHTCFGTKEYQQNIWRSDCYQALGKLVMAHFEIRDSLKGLAEIQTEPKIRPWCHAFGHVLGQQEFKKTGSIAETFLACSSQIACGEGCFHGAVEGYLQSHGGGVTKEVIRSACDKKTIANTVTFAACIHGLGHAAMLEEGENIQKALPLCEYLPSDNDRHICYSGVFMEDTLMFGGSNTTSTVQPSDPEYPCNELNPKYKDECYAAHSTFVLQQSRSDYTTAGKFCDHIPDAYRPSCYGSFGGQAVLASDSPSYEASVCAGVARTEDRNACLVQAMIFKGYSTAGKLSGYRELCEAVASASPQDINACWSFAGDDIERWYPTKRAESCSEITPANSDAYLYCAGVRKP